MDKILKKCDISICKAACCGPVPIQNSVIRKFKSLINEGSTRTRMGDASLLYHSETLRCGFLSSEHICKIYENRPDVCRKFAEPNETDIILKCHHLGQILHADALKEIEKRLL